VKKSSKGVLIEGAEGNIELRYHTVSDDEQAVKLVVLSHPHPLYGGTMNNKVVTTMERAFHALGYVTIAYNFRGVGKSEGEYDHGHGEQEDLMAVVDWARQQFNVEHLTLAGFSFGSYVSLKAQSKIEVQALCTVAPPVGLYDFADIDPVKIPWVLIQGGQDEVVEAKGIVDWAISLEHSPDIYWRANAGHFFHGELIWLKQNILLIFKE